MLVERSELTIREGMEEAFTAMLRDGAKPLLEGVQGVTAVEYGRGVENPSKFVLLVTWTTMAAHDAFRTIPANQELRQLLGPYAIGGTMEHFEMV